MSRKGSLLRIKEKIMAKLWADFYDCFIDAKTYLLYLEGLRNTVFIALIACAIGFVIGVVVTAVRIAPKTNLFVRVADAVAKVYVTVIRGTPVVLQLFIGYFVIFATMKFSGLLGISNTDGIPVAGLRYKFGGVYVRDIAWRNKLGRLRSNGSGKKSRLVLVKNVCENCFTAGFQEYDTYDFQRIYYVT